VQRDRYAWSRYGYQATPFDRVAIKMLDPFLLGEVLSHSCKGEIGAKIVAQMSSRLKLGRL
jgi:hypothetical protein